MSDMFPVLLSSIQTDMARAERAAMNLANSQTPGYKREVAATPFATRVDAGGASLAAALPQRTQTDLRAGTLKTTGQALDVAIAGEGWFEVSTPEGPAYTRQGNFRLDAQGRLVTQQGHLVMGTSGVIHLAHGSPRIDEAGFVFEGGRTETGLAGVPPAAVGQIKVVQLDGHALRRIGGGLMAHDGTAPVNGEGAAHVRQGLLENSNVDPMREMVELMQSVRHLETLQKVALGYDEMLGASIRKLGENG